jgi:hypothetical protein
MTLGEQLDELRNNILRDRSDLVSGGDDRLWSDETLVSYIGDGEKRFARRTLMLRDSTTPEVTRVKLREGVRLYPLHKSVLAVLSAGYDTNTFDLQRSGHGLIVQDVSPEFLSVDPSSSYGGWTGAFSTDETLVYARQSTVTLSVSYVPSQEHDGKFIHMRVIRLPMSCYTVDSLDEASEIPEDYQLDVLEWAAYRAMRSFDADVDMPVSAKDHKDAFDEAVARAITETKLKMFSNITIAYGGNGFSYTR